MADVNFKELAAKMSSDELEVIRKLHHDASCVLTMIDTMVAFKQSYTGKAKEAAQAALEELNKQLTGIECSMQEAWGIRVDPNYHTWWLKSNHCTCPKMDNLDPLFFGGGAIIDNECPVHYHETV